MLLSYDTTNTLKIGNFLCSHGRFLQARSHLILFIAVSLHYKCVIGTIYAAAAAGIKILEYQLVINKDDSVHESGGNGNNMHYIRRD